MECEIVDVRTSWGDVQFLVKPVVGSGEQWVSTSRIIKSII